MRYCSYCGMQLNDEDRFCPHCGKEVVNQAAVQPYADTNAIYTNHDSKEKKGETGLQTAAKVFMVIGTVVLAIPFLIPLAWCLPMTISYFNKVNNGEEVSIGFKICCLLFVSLLAGIFMLVDDAN